MEGNKGAMGWIIWLLVIIGALNWGLIGGFNYNLVDSIFGAGSMVARVIYIIVGLAAIYLIIAKFSKK